MPCSNTQRTRSSRRFGNGGGLRWGSERSYRRDVGRLSTRRRRRGWRESAGLLWVSSVASQPFIAPGSAIPLSGGEFSGHLWLTFIYSHSWVCLWCSRWLWVSLASWGKLPWVCLRTWQVKSVSLSKTLRSCHYERTIRHQWVFLTDRKLDEE